MSNEKELTIKVTLKKKEFPGSKKEFPGSINSVNSILQVKEEKYS